MTFAAVLTKRGTLGNRGAFFVLASYFIKRNLTVEAQSAGSEFSMSSALSRSHFTNARQSFSL
jgi:hypothetical protein